MAEGKKGITGIETIIVLIVLILFAVIYFAWLKDFRILGEKLGDYEICKASNLENAKLKLKAYNFVLDERKDSPYNAANKCKTEYVNVQKGKEMQTISESMAGCWDKYLEGKQRLFETEDNTYCAFCSVLTFNDKNQISGLTDYLMQNEAKGKNKKYFEYLTDVKITNDVMQVVENENLKKLYKIDTSKPLAVIFLMSKNIYPDSLLKLSAVQTGGIGAIAGGAAGATAVAGLLVYSGVGVCFGGAAVTLGASCVLGGLLIGIGTIVGAAGGGGAGLMVGSVHDPDIDAKILLVPYTKEDLSKLKCTKLEGKDQLEIKKY